MSELKFRKVPISRELRIQISKRNRGKLEPNCFGTAFFLLGILPYDMVIFTNENNENIRKVLDKMLEWESPRNNSVMISYCNEGSICHAAYIKKTKPLKGYHRTGAEGDFEKIFQLSDIDEYLHEAYYGTKNFTHKFYSVSNSEDLSIWAKEMVERYQRGWWA